MRKLINDPFAVVDQMIDGIEVAFSRQVTLTPSRRGIVARTGSPTRRVGLVTGGGSGHEPAFFGYVGPGWADGVALGNVFASPSARPIIEVAQRVNRGDGVLFVYGNYDGDIMNFEMASELLAEKGVPTLQIRVTDDLLGGRGVAGDVFVLKAAGARADEGGSLTEVYDAAAHANARTRTIGVGLGACTVPAAGKPTFELPDGTMDVGMGVHGEAGRSRRALETADDVADELVGLLLEVLQPDGRVYVLVNTLGATPLMEALIVLRRVSQKLDELAVPIYRARVGEYVTSLEMAGLSLTLVALDDDLQRLFDAPAYALAAPPLSAPW